MQNNIVLSSYPAILLSKVPLKTIGQLIQAGVAPVSSFSSLTLPASTISIFLFLQNQATNKKNSEMTQKQIQSIVDCILSDHMSVTERRVSSESLNEELAPLQDQIIEVIYQIDPKVLQRFYVDYKLGKETQVQQGIKITVEQKNNYSLHNVIKLGLKTLNKLKLQKRINQAMKSIIIKIVFPIFFTFVQLSSEIQKQTFQIIKDLLVSAESPQFQRYASQLFSDFYCDFWSKRSFSSQDLKIVNLLQRHLRLLEIIHYNIPYHKQIVESALFKAHLKKLFTFTGQNKGSIHLLSINLFQKITQHQQDNTSTQVFANLFNILGCYGVHLIKDVWPSFYSLLSNQQNSLFSTLQLIQIILHKLQFHQNANVIKHCMNQILKNQQSNIFIFQKTPTIVYNKILPMLNLGVHYADSKFHMDSKIYALISSFFLRYYNSQTISCNQLQKQLKQFLAATLALPNNDHALIALLMVFKNLKRSIKWVGLDEVIELRNLIVRSYTRYPIRKRYQMIDSILILLGEHLNEQQVKIKDLLQLFTQINQQYLLQLNFVKFTKILQKYGDSQIYKYLNNQIQNTILALKNNSVFENQESVAQALCSINKIQFFILFTAQVTNNEQLTQSIVFFKNYLHDLIIQYGQSLYKTETQRKFIINAYHLLQDNSLSYFNKTISFSPHLEAVLNLIALYASHKNDNQTEGQEKTNKINSKILDIVYKLFFRAYAWNQYEQFSQRQGQRVILARMFEWAYDNIHTDIGYNVVIAGLRARINVNKQKQLVKERYLHYQNLFEQTLYEIYNDLRELQQKNWKADNYLSRLSRDKQLRLYILTSTILLTDITHQIYKQPPNIPVLADMIDRYDFQNYQEICWFIQCIYCRWPAESIKDQVFTNINKEEELKQLTRQLQVLLQNMVHNLEYSLQKKQIINICELTTNIIFRNITLNHSISPSLIDFTIKLIKVGQNYLIFHRAITLAVIEGLIKYFEDIILSNFSALIPLLIQLMTVEEYRGFDSAVYCFNQNSNYGFYRSFVSDLQYNYHSTVPRFLFIHSFQKYILAKYQTASALQFYGQLIEKCIDIALAVVAKQKMFLSGKNKIKLQIWQFLLAFQPEHVYNSLKGQKMNKLLVKCIQLMGHSSIPEIRYYFEVFLMKILLNQSLLRCITNQVLQALNQGLSSFYGNINRSVAFMITSGVVIKHVSTLSPKDNEHFNTIKQSFIKVYNSLLTYVCSAVAYFRGISQYFCLQDISGCLQTKYVSILRQNYMMDPDANTLKEKLSSVINAYVTDILNWDIQRQVLCKIPNQNNNVICQHYYMEVLKKIGTELANVTKNQDGFTAYRYIWKKNVVINQNQELQIENEEESKPEQIDEEEGVFQRKIDPTLQFIYGNETRSYLKLFVTSAKSVALIGHLARTGQIFGIQQLIIPQKSVIQLDSFKSISVTAERWLKISQWSSKNSKSKDQNAFKALLRCKTQGYEIVKLSKSRNKQEKQLSRIGQKCVLVLDQQQWLPDNCWNLIDQQLQMGRYLSIHVQASIFIWSYFKKYVNMN